MTYRLPSTCVTIGVEFISQEVEEIFAEMEANAEPQGSRNIGVRFKNPLVAKEILTSAKSSPGSLVPFQIHLLRTGEMLDYGHTSLSADPKCSRTIVITAGQPPSRNSGKKTIDHDGHASVWVEVLGRTITSSAREIRRKIVSRGQVKITTKVIEEREEPYVILSCGHSVRGVNFDCVGKERRRIRCWACEKALRVSEEER